MRAYLEVAKAYFKAQLSWRFNIGSSVLFSAIKVLFAAIVWRAVFGQRSEVAGFTLSSMLSYYVASSFFSQLENINNTGWMLQAEIRSGAFSKYMVLPMGVEGYFHARYAGIVLLSGLFVFCGSAIWALLLGIPLVFTHQPGLICAAILVEIMALIFVDQLNYLIGLISLKFVDTGAFLMIKSNLLSFLTGQVVPLVLLPAAALPILKLLPFYYVTYLPSMLLVGRNADEAIWGMLVLFLWILLLALLNPLCYSVLRKHYDGVGI